MIPVFFSSLHGDEDDDYDDDGCPFSASYVSSCLFTRMSIATILVGVGSRRMRLASSNAA